MASQLPMVTTSVGVAGLGAKPGRDILVGDDSETFSRQLIKIMKSPKLGQELGENSRKIVEESYDYEKIAEKLSQIYLSLAKKK